MAIGENKGALGGLFSDEDLAFAKQVEQNSWKQTPVIKQGMDIVHGTADALGNTIAGVGGGLLTGAAGVVTGEGAGAGWDFVKDRNEGVKEGLSRVAGGLSEVLTGTEAALTGYNKFDQKVENMQSVATPDEMQAEFAKEIQNEKAYQHSAMMKDLQNLKQNGGTFADAEKMINRDISEPASKEQLIALSKEMYAQGEPEGPYDHVKKSQAQLDAEQAAKNVAAGVDPEEVINKSTIHSNALQSGENAMHKAASNIATRMETPKNWYENQSFRTGMLRLGLGIMAGEDLATAFNGATESYQHNDLINQRSRYRDEMIESGYEPFRVDQWIRNGGNISKPATGRTGTTWKDAERHGIRGQVSSAGEWKPYSKDVLDRLGVSGGSGYSGKLAYNASPQIDIGSQMMPAANANWNRKWGGDIKDYPMARDLGGSISYITGTDSASGRALHSTFLADQRKARSDEEAWLQSYGRPLSGGAITGKEWDSWGGYLFPRPDDNKDDALMKQYMRDNVSYTIAAMKDKGLMDAEGNPKRNEEILTQTITSAQNLANGIVDFDPDTGIYLKKDGSMWHPAYGEIPRAKK